ncbi:hypothetical protein AYL99_05480 [Fonsecaea erecta]|uniref:Uncharacterized protein n=1 Tax=Fonsecaea erecta TaxID=1367422 RepID=A0A178ZL05_9EURO|nr:hypothetical protein AYL99_05480 [Fonsecaea erecta]OAP60478.1 hypothetical protein AYL99_05480 [Fonsecaea erecta]
MYLAFGLATSKDIHSWESAAVEKLHLQKYIREWCGLFVFIERSNIYLAHQTAKEFLIRESEMVCGVWKHSLIPADTATVMVQMCVRAICWPLGIYHQLFFDKNPGHQFVEDTSTLVAYAQDSLLFHLTETKMDRLDLLHDALCLVRDQLQAGALLPEQLKTGSLGHHFLLLRRMTLLLAQVADLFYCKKPSRWILHCAAVLVDIIRKLVDLDVEGSYATYSWCEALVFSAEQGSEQILRILLCAGEKFKLKERDLYNALLAAVKRGHTHVVRILLDAGADVNRGNENVLRAAIDHGHGDVVLLLLRADLNNCGKGNGFEGALVDNQSPEVERLLKLKVQVLTHDLHDGFWLDLSSDVDEVKRIISILNLPYLTWHTDTLADFRCPNREVKKYSRLGFLRRQKKKERRARIQSLIPKTVHEVRDG